MSHSNIPLFIYEAFLSFFRPLKPILKSRHSILGLASLRKSLLGLPFSPPTRLQQPLALQRSVANLADGVRAASFSYFSLAMPQNLFSDSVFGSGGNRTNGPPSLSSRSMLVDHYLA